MKSWGAFCAGLMCAALTTTAVGQSISFPRGQGALKPGESTSLRKATIEPGPIVLPGPEVPESVRGLSGRWAGWMCVARTCSAALEVVSLTAKGGRLRHVQVNPHLGDYDLFPIPIDVSLVNGNELEGRWRYISIKVRLRPDGNVDIIRHSGVLSWGVLSRIP